MRLRSGLIFLRVWRSPDFGLAVGAGAFFFAGAASCFGLESALSMSPFVTRPSLPVPATFDGSMADSLARRLTAGETASEPLFEAGSSELVDSADALDSLATAFSSPLAGFDPPELAPSSIVATMAPIFTSVPSSTLMEMVPATSAKPSDVILSVSS